MASLALTVAYDGTGFAGAQTQPGLRTVQGEVEAAVGRLFGQPNRIVLAGRTDRGVHAAGQVVGVADGRPDWSEERLRTALNALLPPDCSVVRVVRAPDDFHARYDAAWREYRYRIWTGGRAPLARNAVWERRGALRTDRLAAGARRFVGTHDFASFAGHGEGVPGSDRGTRPRGTERSVSRCEVRARRAWWGDDEGELWELRVVADGFLPQMVRAITGVLVEVGQGRREPEWVSELLAVADRRQGGGLAPPHGLTLWRVGYGLELPEEWPDAIGLAETERERNSRGRSRGMDEER